MSGASVGRVSSETQRRMLCSPWKPIPEKPAPPWFHNVALQDPNQNYKPQLDYRVPKASWQPHITADTGETQLNKVFMQSPPNRMLPHATYAEGMNEILHRLCLPFQPRLHALSCSFPLSRAIFTAAGSGVLCRRSEVLEDCPPV